MPLPSNALTTSIEQAIDKAFEDKGITTKKERASKALDNMGLSIEDLAMHLANLILSSKDSVKRNAILDALALHGINLKAEAADGGIPNIVFQVSGSNVNLNNLFAPQRNIEERK